jgi:hypothetical protein
MKIAWQKIKRDEYSLTEDAPEIICPLKESTVVQITVKEAKPYILKYEWLGKMPGFSRFAFGHYFGSHVGGVLVLGDTGGSDLSFKKMLPDRKVIVLQRGINLWWTPKNSASYFITRVIRWLKENTDYSAITATADEEAGEIGTIYQSLGWNYLGIPKHGHPVFLIDGKEVHPKTLYDKHGTSSVDRIKIIYGNRVEIRPRMFKHRYIKIFRGENGLSTQAYPKRNDQETQN